MKPDSDRVRDVFLEALPMGAEERAAYLERACAGDPELRRAVEELLEAKPGSRFLEPPSDELEEELPHEFGDFTLLERLPGGGMGVVYKARQHGLGRLVAIKVLRGGLGLTERTVQRFDHEGVSVARLHHPNIVAIHSVGKFDGVRFIAMEWVEGRDLERELRRLTAELSREGQKQPPDGRAHLPSSRAAEYFRSVADLMRQAADGLAHAHEHGVVHRDIKPSNLMLDDTGHLRIVDFGLARDQSLGTLTRSNELLGTLFYMSPEQARGVRNEIDQRTDVYSLGVVLYELLTLRRPIEGDSTPEILDNVIRKFPRAPRAINPRIPRDLELICERAIEKRPGDRFQTARELRDELQRFLNGEALGFQPPSAFERARRVCRRHRVRIAVLGALVIGLSLGTIGIREYQHRARIRALHATVLEARSVSLEDLQPARLLELRGALRELQQDAGVQAGEREDAVQDLARRFDELRESLREQGLADLGRSRDSSQPEGVREFLRLRSLQTLNHASYVFPEDDELRDLASLETAYPTLTVRAVGPDGAEIGAEVFLRPVDIMTTEVGPSSSLGRTPLLEHGVPPGYYRVVVQFDEGGFTEHPCNPGPAFMRLEVKAHRRADAPDTGDMILIPGGTFVVPDFEGERFLQGQTLELEDFWIDAAEVSVSEYFSFLTATGRPQPPLWRHAPDLEAFVAEYGDHPATGMTWSDAVAYAEFVGKRLPTAGEWHRMAGGPEGWPLPYSPDPQAPPLGNIQAAPPQPRTQADTFDIYLRYSSPVRSHPEARTPEGVFNVYGNAAELTESMAVVQAAEGLLMPRPFDRFFLGQGWQALAWGNGMRATSYWGIGPHYTAEFIGFRCAKSAAH